MQIKKKWVGLTGLQQAFLWTAMCLFTVWLCVDDSLLVYPNAAANIYGNSVVWKGSSALLNYPFTSWINTNTTLAPGILKHFYLFIDRRNTYPSLKRLQIWRPLSGSRSQYELIWERIANFSGAHAGGRYIYEVWLDSIDSIVLVWLMLFSDSQLLMSGDSSVRKNSQIFVQQSWMHETKCIFDASECVLVLYRI